MMRIRMRIPKIDNCIMRMQILLIITSTSTFSPLQYVVFANEPMRQAKRSELREFLILFYFRIP
jgi:hypothetical protein